MLRRLRKSVFILLLCTATSAYGSSWQFDNVSRIVAMADVHGAWAPMVDTLRNAGVIDDSLTWVGDTTHLVIAGDMLDRGPDSRKVMDLLMRLETEAVTAGGRVHVLIGNHEAMNLVGDLRYVSLAEYAAFAAEETDEERESGFAAWLERNGDDTITVDELRGRFESAHPPGFFAHRRAFASDGVYGTWLLQKPLVVVVNGTAFVHGGLSPLIAEIGLGGVNDILHAELVQYVRVFGELQKAGVLLPSDSFYDHAAIAAAYLPGLDASAETIAALDAIQKLVDSDAHAVDGPLWYRGNVYCSPLIEQERLDAALAAIGADRVVIGHTPTPGRRVLQRLDGRVIEVDTGMLGEYYNGRGHALILEGESLQVVSEESVEALSPAQHPRRVGARPGEALSAADIEQLLRTGSVSNRREDAERRVIVTVSAGENTVEALFAEREGRGFYPEVAAYRLDRLLGLAAVPVAVVRDVDGRAGSLQFLPHGWLDELQRSASGGGGSASCPLPAQWSAMYVYDSLIYNERRTAASMIYSPDIWQLVLVSHSRSFANKSGRPRHLEPVQLDIGLAWRASLISLNDEVLEAELGDVLDRRRRRAILNRRDQLLRTN